jgi:hypothetical protein
MELIEMTYEILNTEVLTDEARIIITKYIDEVTFVLGESDLNETEISASINELTEHLVSLCKLKSDEKGIITTDLVHSAIQKLGSPKQIRDTLIGELEFNEELLSLHRKTKTKKIDEQSEPIKTKRDYTIDITAGFIANIFYILSWSLTGCLFFIAFGGDEFMFLYLVIYIFTVLFLMFIRSHKSYNYNSYLNSNVKLNLHIVGTPILYFTYFFSHGLYYSPLVLIIWLMIATTNMGREYHLELYNKIFRKDR